MAAVEKRMDEFVHTWKVYRQILREQIRDSRGQSEPLEERRIDELAKELAFAVVFDEE